MSPSVSSVAVAPGSLKVSPTYTCMGLAPDRVITGFCVSPEAPPPPPQPLNIKANSVAIANIILFFIITPSSCIKYNLGLASWRSTA